MKVTNSLVKKIRIEDINETHRLDPVEVLIENYGEGAGRIIITCCGESWTGFWGSMGGTVEEFFQHVSNDYLISKIADYGQMEPDLDADADFLRSEILRQRKSGHLDSLEAEVAWRYVNRFFSDRNSLFYSETPPDLEPLEGMSEPWNFDWPNKNNYKYDYLSRILDVVREVIKSDE